MAQTIALGTKVLGKLYNCHLHMITWSTCILPQSSIPWKDKAYWSWSSLCRREHNLQGNNY